MSRALFDRGRLRYEYTPRRALSNPLMKMRAAPSYNVGRLLGSERIRLLGPFMEECGFAKRNRPS